MADFSKKIGRTKVTRKINPIEIYETLDRRSETGPLRPIQKEILEKWSTSFKGSRDIILKLHTGQGKTLIGLLILQSFLNQDKGPVLYLCPNKHLAVQTAEQAKKFGFQFDLLEEEIPFDYTAGKRMLIGHVQKLFNGLTKFGLQRKSLPAAAVVLDDSHACIDAIKASFTISISREEDLYSDLVEIFEDDLKGQGLAQFQEIKLGEYNAFLLVPYWAWIDKNEKVVEILAAAREELAVRFQWPVLKNVLLDCQCFVSGQKIEISSYINPIEQFGTFATAGQRILMSATTLDDSFFIKGLGLSVDAIKKPLRSDNEKWSGEKMILIPGLIDESLDRIKIINELVRPNARRKFGLVVLVPSFKRAEIYGHQKCTIATSSTIQEEVQRLKDGNYEKPLVIVNRYDGIDLPDDSCRLLIMDSKPIGESLLERYEEMCRSKSELIQIRTAQKIEQGLGRSVRGEKDYSVIIFLDDELVSFIYSGESQSYFSSHTRKQIDIGKEVAALAIEEINTGIEPMKAVLDLVGQCIRLRDENWKSFYAENMNEIDSNSSERKDLTRILKAEYDAELASLLGESNTAVQTIQKMMDEEIVEETEKAYYMQVMARFKYKTSKLESNKLQISAYKKNLMLLKPKSGITYQRIGVGFINATRLENIRKWLEQHHDYMGLQFKVDEILSNLAFGENHEKFERSLNDVGTLLGFHCQRPDREIKQGPDNLWCVGKNEFFLFECKNEVKDDRSEISRFETGQMNNSCGWFELNYPGTEVKRIMVHPIRNVAAGGAFNHKVDILRKGKLKLLKENIRFFIKEFQRFQLGNLTDDQVHQALETHKLDLTNLKTLYTEEPRQLT